LPIAASTKLGCAGQQGATRKSCHGRDPTTSTSRNFAAILLLLLVAVEFEGGSLLNVPRQDS